MNKEFACIILLYIIYILPCSITTNLSAQSSYVIIDRITIEGNKKTKDKIIFRELDISPGDSILLDQIQPSIEKNEGNLLNTNLFTVVKIHVKNWRTTEHTIDLHIELKELIYIWPVPVFELADRNFNVWWTEYNRSLSRVNFGARLYHNNLTGNIDRLKLVAQFGFKRKFEVEYSLPYINRRQTLGVSFGGTFATQKNLPYITTGNKRTFTSLDEERLLTRRALRINTTYRLNYLTYHNIKVAYYNNTVNNRIVDSLNAEFFEFNETRQKFFLIGYEFLHDTRDFKLYPTSGNQFRVLLIKQGLGLFDDIDLLDVELSFQKFVLLKPKWSFEGKVKGKTELTRNKPPYYQNRGLGFNKDFIRGYELYVLDGQHYAYLQSTLRYKVLEGGVNLKKAMPLKKMKFLPFQLFVDVHMDNGVVHDRFFAETNPLTNHWLLGYGVGVDFLLYNNYLFQFDISRNKEGEIGLFFEYNIDF